MFKVEDKTTGEIFTVYGLNGTHFLIYDKEHEWWFYKDMNECRPCICEIDVGVELVDIETARGYFNDSIDTYRRSSKACRRGL